MYPYLSIHPSNLVIKSVALPLGPEWVTVTVSMNKTLWCDIVWHWLWHTNVLLCCDACFWNPEITIWRSKGAQRQVHTSHWRECMGLQMGTLRISLVYSQVIGMLKLTLLTDALMVPHERPVWTSKTKEIHPMPVSPLAFYPQASLHQTAESLQASCPCFLFRAVNAGTVNVQGVWPLLAVLWQSVVEAKSVDRS